MDTSRSTNESETIDRGRRRFLTLAGPAVGLGLSACNAGSDTAPAQANAPAGGPAQAVPTRFDFTRESGALEPDTVVRSACQFCNSLCGIEVLKKGGRVIGIRGDADDPVAKGGL